MKAGLCRVLVVAYCVALSAVSAASRVEADACIAGESEPCIGGQSILIQKNSAISHTRVLVTQEPQITFLPMQEAPSAAAVQLIIEHMPVGCAKRSTGDESDDPHEYMDETCKLRAAHSGACRSGLPFFRLKLQAGQSYLDCFTFCLSKGLDLFGIMENNDSKECRCGATRGNQHAWFGQDPPAELLLPASVYAEDSPNCAMPIWQYTGGLVANGVPDQLYELTEIETAYMESIVLGHDVPADAERNDDASETARGLNLVPAGSWSPCYPDACGPLSQAPYTGLTWRTKDATGNVIVKYYFDVATIPSNDTGRVDAFRAAAAQYHLHTCIKIVEVSQPTTEIDFQETPMIKVGRFSDGSCSAYLNGGMINLGWCNSMASKGSMMHEIMHALGVNHEQKRPDAQEQITLPDGTHQGPFLEVHWGSISSRWKGQYLPDASSYIGSGNQGSGDPFSGYAAYDYESIMHYGGGSSFDTFPNAAYESVVGQRSHLTAGDILQINDMYQCTAFATGPTPPPTPAPPAGWSLESGGSCTETADGGCIQSSGFESGGPYGLKEACTIDVTGTVQLDVRTFATESGYDKLTVNNVEYSGDGNGLQGIAAAGKIHWTSDHTIVSPGWKICREGSPTDAPTVSPAPTPTQSPTQSPTDAPTVSPTPTHTQSPTQSPTDAPTDGSTPPTMTPVWKAGGWGLCEARILGACNVGYERSRTVECVNVQDNSAVERSLCSSHMALPVVEDCSEAEPVCLDLCFPRIEKDGVAVTCLAFQKEDCASHPELPTRCPLTCETC